MERRRVVLLGLASATAALGAWLVLREPQVPEVASAAGWEVADDHPEAGPALAGLTDEARAHYRAQKLRRWRARLAGEDGPTRLEALRAWESQGLDVTQAASELIGLLGDASNDVRREARAILLSLGARAIPALLTVGLRHEDPFVPGQVIEVLGALGLRGEDDVVLRTLLGILGDAQASGPHREFAGVALGRLRPVSGEMLAALLAAARDANDEVAACAIDGMAWLHADGEPLVEPLLALLGPEGSSAQRDEILRALGAIKRRPDLVLPRLLALAEVLPWDPEAQGAALCFRAEALPHLAQALDKGTTHQAFFALQTIQLQGAAAASLADAVVARLEREPDLFHDALGALGNIGVQAASHLPLIQSFLDDESKDWTEVREALLTLAAFGARGEAAVDAALLHERARPCVPQRPRWRATACRGSPPGKRRWRLSRATIPSATCAAWRSTLWPGCARADLALRSRGRRICPSCPRSRPRARADVDPPAARSRRAGRDGGGGARGALGAAPASPAVQVLL